MRAMSVKPRASKAGKIATTIYQALDTRATERNFQTSVAIFDSLIFIFVNLPCFRRTGLYAYAVFDG
jgi:hypothetical protein